MFNNILNNDTSSSCHTNPYIINFYNDIKTGVITSDKMKLFLLSESIKLNKYSNDYYMEVRIIVHPIGIKHFFPIIFKYSITINYILYFSNTSYISGITTIPIISRFAFEKGFNLVLADHQNYYPDMSFVFIENPSIKYAVDIKTTYRLAACGARIKPSIKSSALNIVTKPRINPYDIKYIPKIKPVEIFLLLRQK